MRLKVVDPLGTGNHEAGFPVKMDISGYGKGPRSKTSSHLHRVPEQGGAVALVLLRRGYADGSKRHTGDCAAAIRPDLRAGIHHMADEFAVPFQHKIQFRNKVRPAPKAVQDIMLQTPGSNFLLHDSLLRSLTE